MNNSNDAKNEREELGMFLSEKGSIINMLRKESKWNHTKFSIKTHKRQKKSKE